MKHRTRLRRILGEKNKKVKKLKLINYAFTLMPNSIAQKEVRKEIDKL